jgi:hypothetical protein
MEMFDSDEFSHVTLMLKEKGCYRKYPEGVCSVQGGGLRPLLTSGVTVPRAMAIGWRCRVVSPGGFGNGFQSEKHSLSAVSGILIPIEQ